MKNEEIKVGGTYLAKVTGRVVPVRLDRENARGGWDATNLLTNKQIRIKSAQRLRGPAERSAGPAERSAGPAERSAGPAPQRHARHAAAVTTPQLDEHRTARQDELAAAAGNDERIAPPPKAASARDQKKVSGLDAAHQVLSDAGEPMRCGDMVEKMLAMGLWKTDGKTPAATIYAAIVREIKLKGAAARFRKTDRGLFTTSGK